MISAFTILHRKSITSMYVYTYIDGHSDINRKFNILWENGTVFYKSNKNCEIPCQIATL